MNLIVNLNMLIDVNFEIQSEWNLLCIYNIDIMYIHICNYTYIYIYVPVNELVARDKWEILTKLP